MHNTVSASVIEQAPRTQSQATHVFMVCLPDGTLLVQSAQFTAAACRLGDRARLPADQTIEQAGWTIVPVTVTPRVSP